MRLLIAALIALSTLPSCGSASPPASLMPALERMAAAGNAEATYHVGMAYHVGLGVPRDEKKALAAFERATKLGDVLASYKLGCFYAGQGGDLVKPDPTLVLRHKLKAAEAGYALAQQDVAALYAADGDFPTALRWLEKAAAQGTSDALRTYASVYNGAPGVTPDAVKTSAYFRLFLDRVEATDKQREWLKTFEQRMTPEQRLQADAIVRNYRPAPTAITLKALSGQRAAEALVAQPAGS